MARNANATVPRCWYTLVRNRPTPGTPIAKSASLCSANSFTWRGVMICSASDFSSSGLSGAVSSPTSSPFTRIVAGRPTLSSRSEPLRWTICVMAVLKLNAGALPAGASAMRIHPEKDLPELDRLRVLHAYLSHDAGDLGLDLVHDLHRFDDAHHLAHVHPAARLHVGLRSGLGRLVEGTHHRGLDLEQVGDRRNRRVPHPRHPHRRPGAEQPPPDLDGAHLRGILQDLHQLGDDVELHTENIRLLGPYTSSTRSVRPSDKRTGPAADRWTSSSMRTPPRPGTYTPGSTVTTASSGSGSAAVRARRGASCTSSPRPCPVECPKALPKPRASIGSRARASASRPGMPARTPSRARRWAPWTSSYSARCASVARAPTTTVRAMSAQ